MVAAALKDAKGLLLYGPPGAGKAQTARALAAELGAAFLSRTAEQLSSPEAFTPVLAEADGRPAVLFIEGLDSPKAAVDALLSEMEALAEWQVMVVAAARRPELLDPALLRDGRFSLRLPVGLPDVKDRVTLLKLHSHGAALADDVNFEHVAKKTSGLSNDDLAEVVRGACSAAGSRGTVLVAAVDFQKALDRFTLEHSRTPVLSGADRMASAYHEAGHALASHLLPGVQPVRKFTLLPHGLNASMLMEVARCQDHRVASRFALIDKMALALAGRVAEELGLGEARPCAQDDVDAARRIAEDIVGQLFIGEQIEAEVGKLMAEALDLAKRALSAHQSALDALTAELLARETLTAVDVQRLLRA